MRVTSVGAKAGMKQSVMSNVQDGSRSGLYQDPGSTCPPNSVILVTRCSRASPCVLCAASKPASCWRYSAYRGSQHEQQTSG